MSPDGYTAFAAWCATHGVQPVSREQYESWPMPRFQRHMNKLLKRGKTADGNSTVGGPGNPDGHGTLTLF